MSWSGLKKRIEERFAVSLQGRVSLYATKSRTTYGAIRVCGIRIDGKEIVSGSAYERYYQPQTVESDNQHSFFNSDDFYHATQEYLDLSIDDIISSSNLVIRAIGMLDGRLGKLFRAPESWTSAANLGLVQRSFFELRAHNTRVQISGFVHYV